MQHSRGSGIDAAYNECKGSEHAWPRHFLAPKIQPCRQRRGAAVRTERAMAGY